MYAITSFPNKFGGLKIAVMYRDVTWKLACIVQVTVTHRYFTRTGRKGVLLKPINGVIDGNFPWVSYYDGIPPGRP